MAAYYNENDPYAAEWLRNLIKADLIAPGHVDERSIADVEPEDLQGFTQCHFFAGIGVWSHALRCAEWPDDRPVWTGSCPCQPFSGAGKRGGASDERHLWPAWFDLIRECRPGLILGEQVASKDALGWWDAVQDHLEGEAYASAALDLCVPGVGGPHIRQRLYWMAYAVPTGRAERRAVAGDRSFAGMRASSGMADSDGGNAGAKREQRSGEHGQQPQNGGVSRRLDDSARERYGAHDVEPVAGRRKCATRPAGGACVDGLADSGSQRRQQNAGSAHGDEKAHGRARRDRGKSDQHHQPSGHEQIYRHSATSPLNGFWRDADWLFCRDGKWRPVEPGTFPLVDGAANRVGQLRAYGNAIVAPQAAEFVEAVMDVMEKCDHDQVERSSQPGGAC